MQHSTTYIIGFSTVICVVCALFVSTAEVSLRPLKERNIRIDRQKNILAVAGLMRPGEELDAQQIEGRFETSIRPVLIDLATGEENTALDPNAFDQRAAARDPARSSRELHARQFCHASSRGRGTRPRAHRCVSQIYNVKGLYILQTADGRLGLRALTFWPGHVDRQAEC